MISDFVPMGRGDLTVKVHRNNIDITVVKNLNLRNKVQSGVNYERSCDTKDPCYLSPIDR